MGARACIALVLLATLGACSVEVEPRTPSVFDEPDGGAGLPPPPPTLDAVSVRVPWPVIPLSGRAPGAQRILIEEGGRTLTDRVFPDGTFCVDAPLEVPGLFTFVVWAQDPDGRFSERAATLSVVFDPAAPPPAGAALCDGSDPAECTGTELCGNGIDDDCNGAADDLDQACASCPPDALEPNDGSDSPRIEPGVYAGLEICPGDRDVHPIALRSGEELRASIAFTHEDGNLDLRLVDLAHGRTVTTREGTEDGESLRHAVTQDGWYALEVYGRDGARNGYSLEVEVR